MLPCQFKLARIRAYCQHFETQESRLPVHPKARNPFPYRNEFLNLSTKPREVTVQISVREIFILEVTEATPAIVFGYRQKRAVFGSA